MVELHEHIIIDPLSKSMILGKRIVSTCLLWPSSWSSALVAAFLLPPPLQSRLSPRSLSSVVVQQSSLAFVSRLWNPLRQQSLALSSSLIDPSSADKKRDGAGDGDGDAPPPIRVGIIGGGIAGVSVAHALQKRLAAAANNNNNNPLPSSCQIHVLEAEDWPVDKEEHEQRSLSSSLSTRPYEWTAATARNGNSIVPGASFFVFSEPSSLLQVFTDTAWEWWELQKEKLGKLLIPHKQQQSLSPAAALPILGRLQDFAVVPPYFALHIGACLGPFSTNASERWSFVRFVRQYLYYTLLVNLQPGNENYNSSERGKQLCQIAQVNRNLYLQLVKQLPQQNKGDGTKTTSIEPLYYVEPSTIGHSQGFLAVHRTYEQALASVEKVRSMGEEAELIESWEEASQMEPRLQSLQKTLNQPLYVVRRPNDYTSSCGDMVRTMIRQQQQLPQLQNNKKNQQLPFVYHRGVQIKSIQSIIKANDDDDAKKNNNNKQLFRIETNDGTIYDYDLLVLAAGIQTPLLASQLGVGEYCPTYPLRGFSLTIVTNNHNNTTNNNNNQQPQGNLLRQPFKIDSMYCSSVAPNMARWVGFGELVGFRGTEVPSLAPAILARYAKAVFPDCTPVVSSSSSSSSTTTTSSSSSSQQESTPTEGTTIAALQEATLPGFRALSPDDLPLVGAVPKLPGLFLHTGHGSLGYTIGLATGEILAAQIQDYLSSGQEGGGGSTKSANKIVKLSDGSEVDASVFAPERFVT